MSVFTGGSVRRPTPNRPKNFCSEYILWRQQRTSSAPEQRLHAATAAFSRLQLAVAAVTSLQTTDCWLS